jgi:hypothetical protein
MLAAVGKAVLTTGGSGFHRAPPAATWIPTGFTR